MLKELIGMAIPISGDIKIHRLCTKDRSNAKKEIQEIKSKGKHLDEKERKFRHELSDLLKKYNLKEEMGSLVSYSSHYVASERSNLGDIRIRTTFIPEIAMYFGKYAILIPTFYQFS